MTMLNTLLNWSCAA